MKAAVLVTFLSALSAVSGRSRTQTSSAPSGWDDMIDGERTEWPSTMYFPGNRGEPRPAKMQEAAGMKGVDESDVFFKLFTRNGPKNGTIIPPGDVVSLKESTFNASEPTYFITHGFLQSIDSDTIQTLKNMYVVYREGNVIAVDWSTVSQQPMYANAKNQTVSVGYYLGAFVAFLVEKGGADPSRIQMTGHSLGGHVVGIAGKNVHTILGKKVGRITGLDPAGPLYSEEDKRHRLDRDDADFVDVIHTCGDGLGMSAPIGHADFYPNGGTLWQPGCSWDFACSSYEDYLGNNCKESPTVPMGHHTPHQTLAHCHDARGTFYLQTAEFPPYAMG